MAKRALLAVLAHERRADGGNEGQVKVSRNRCETYQRIQNSEHAPVVVSGLDARWGAGTDRRSTLGGVA